MSKADANIKIGADSTAFTKDLKGLESKVVDSMAKIGNVFMGALGLKAAAQNIAGAFSAFTAPAAELENVATVLEVMINSREGADRLARSLQHIATNGVVGFDDLFRAARSLTNVFQDDAVITHYIAMLANISAASKIPAERLADMVARMNDMGKVEFTELSNAGIPIIEALADVLGKSRDEVVKLNNEGKIGTRALLEAFGKLTAAGARYHEQNTRQSNTTEGSWDTLKASITECMEALGEPINDSLRPMLQDLSGWVQKNRGAVEKLGANLAPAMREFCKALTVAAPGLLNMGKAVAGITSVVAELAAYLSKGAAVAVYLGGSYHGVAVALALLSAKMKSTYTASTRMQAMMRLMRLKMKKYRAEVMATGVSFKVIMAGMAASARAALASIKAAFARNAITLAVLALGEAVGWLYTKFADTEDAASDMGAAAQEAADAANEALEASRREMELREEATRAERERTQQMEEQARLAQEAADAEKERLRIVAEMARARKENDFEREMDALRDMGEPLGGGAAGVIRARLRRVGVPSEEALYAERGRLERSGSMSEDQQRRYEQVAAAIGKIEEEHRKAEDAARSHREEMERLRENYYDRKRTYNESRAEEAYEKKSIPAQEMQLRRDAQAAGYYGEMNPERIRTYLDALARADAKANERQIAELERILTLHDELVERKQRYEKLRQGDMAAMQIQALELAGRKRAADKLREEMAMQERIAELRERGATKKQAEEQAAYEAKLQRVKEQRERVRGSRVEWVQGHLASVGGGGVSSRIGTSQLAEAKVHTKWLREIYQAVKKAQGQQSSNVAVLA